MLTVKGRYYAPGVPEDGIEKPIFLRIIPASHAGHTDEEKQRAVDAAAAEVESILQGQPIGRTAPRMPARVCICLTLAACKDFDRHYCYW